MTVTWFSFRLYLFRSFLLSFLWHEWSLTTSQFDMAAKHYSWDWVMVKNASRLEPNWTPVEHWINAIQYMRRHSTMIRTRHSSIWIFIWSVWIPPIPVYLFSYFFCVCRVSPSLVLICTFESVDSVTRQCLDTHQLTAILKGSTLALAWLNRGYYLI